MGPKVETLRFFCYKPSAIITLSKSITVAWLWSVTLEGKRRGWPCHVTMLNCSKVSERLSPLSPSDWSELSFPDQSERTNGTRNCNAVNVSEVRITIGSHSLKLRHLTCPQWDKLTQARSGLNFLVTDTPGSAPCKHGKLLSPQSRMLAHELQSLLGGECSQQTPPRALYV